MNRKVMAIVVAGVVVLGLVLAGVWWARQDGGGMVAGANGEAARAVKDPIKVGIILSRETAAAVEWGGQPWGYTSQLKIYPMLENPDLELWPIVEAGSDDDRVLQIQLRAQFPGKTPIDGTDAAKLREMKVIVAWAVWHTSEELLKAVESVVENDGVGLLQGQGLASHKYRIEPDHHILVRLAGLKRAEFSWNPDYVDCVVVGEHPLLGDLSGKTSETFKLSPNGAYGILPEGATPLVKVVNGSLMHPFSSRMKDRPAYVNYPIYLSSLGKGRIMGFQVGPNDPLSALQSATEGKFMVRCAKWLAGEALD